MNLGSKSRTQKTGKTFLKRKTTTIKKNTVIVLQKIFSLPFLCLHQRLGICPGKIYSKLHHHLAFPLSPEIQTNYRPWFNPKHDSSRFQENTHIHIEKETKRNLQDYLLLHLSFKLVPIYCFWLRWWIGRFVRPVDCTNLT